MITPQFRSSLLLFFAFSHFRSECKLIFTSWNLLTSLSAMKLKMTALYSPECCGQHLNHELPGTGARQSVAARQCSEYGSALPGPDPKDGRSRPGKYYPETCHEPKDTESEKRSVLMTKPGRVRPCPPALTRRR